MAESLEAVMAQYRATLGLPPLPPTIVQAAAPAAPTPQAMVMQEIAKAQGPNLLGILWPIVKQALPAADLEFLQAHIKEGAPGIIPFLSSETLQQLIPLAVDEYKEFLAGKSK